MTARSAIAIPEPRLEQAGDLWRISATVAGTEVFFESHTPLSPRSEVLVCPFLLPAMSLHADPPLWRRALHQLRIVTARAVREATPRRAGAVQSPQ
jgi:hypothetical protein